MHPRIIRTVAAPLVGALALVLTLAACGSKGDAPPATGPTGATTTTTGTTTTPSAALDGALWPVPALAVPETLPVEVARSFIVDFVRMPNPALGRFQQGDSRSGEVPVYLRGEGGAVHKDRVIATIALRQLDGKRWFVIAAFSDDIKLDAPQARAKISSPVTIAGEGRGFEGTIAVALHAAFNPKPLAKKALQAGQKRNKPFSGKLAFRRPVDPTGALIARDGGGLDGVTTAFAAIPVRFAAG